MVIESAAIRRRSRRSLDVRIMQTLTTPLSDVTRVHCPEDVPYILFFPTARQLPEKTPVLFRVVRYDSRRNEKCPLLTYCWCSIGRGSMHGTAQTTWVILYYLDAEHFIQLTLVQLTLITSHSSQCNDISVRYYRDFMHCTGKEWRNRSLEWNFRQQKSRDAVEEFPLRQDRSQGKDLKTEARQLIYKFLPKYILVSKLNEDGIIIQSTWEKRLSLIQKFH